MVTVCYRGPTFILVCFAVAAEAAPVGGVVSSGTATITGGTTTTIQQSSANVAIDWQSFNVQSGEQVVFNQPGATSIALNRDFSGAPSQVLGSISANGQVFLINTAGVLIGNGASINTAGLLVSDLSLSPSQFDAFTQTGSMQLTGGNTGSGGIENNGTINTSTRYGVNLIGQYIVNTGDITATNGNINLAVAAGPVVVTDSSGELGVQISQGVNQDLSPNQSLLENSGNIRANPGNISINIQYLSSLNVQAVNNTGLINAVGIGYGKISQNIVLQAPPIDPAIESTADDQIGDSLDDPAKIDDTENSLASDRPKKVASNVDEIVEDCNDPDSQDKECIKKRAIKHYLSRLLIGGGLPD